MESGITLLIPLKPAFADFRVLRQMKMKISTEIPTTVATWAIYGLASYYSHLKKRPSLEKFVDDALPLVAVNLEQFAQPA